MRILLAGKSLITREQLMKYLEENSLQGDIVDCCTGLSALEIVTKCPIDIVIAHLDLPVSGDGAKLLHYAKKFNPNIYTLAVGRGEDYVNLDPALESSIDDFITAPFTLQELGIRLRKIFRTKHEKMNIVNSKENKFPFLNLGKRIDSRLKPSKTGKPLDKEIKISKHSTRNKSSARIKRGGESWDLKTLRYLSTAILFSAFLYILITIFPVVMANPIFLILLIVLAALPVIVFVMHMVSRPPGKREKKRKTGTERISEKSRRNKKNLSFSSYMMPNYRLRNREY